MGADNKKIMSAREYLQRLKSLDYQVTIKISELNELNEIITALGSSASDVKVQTSGTSDKTGNLAIRLTELQKQAIEKCNEWAMMKIEALKLINKMEDRRYQSVLNLYYLQNKTFNETAEKMGVSYQWVNVLHKNAVAEFAEIMHENGLCG